METILRHEGGLVDMTSLTRPLRTEVRVSRAELLGTLLCIVGGAAGLMGQSVTTARVQTRHLSDSVYLLITTDKDSSVTNSLLLVGPEATVLVDHPGDWRTLRASASMIDALRDSWRALQAEDPTLIVNTHWHGDHTAGNVAYANARVVAHHNVRARLAARQTPWWYPDGIGPMPQRGWPDITFVDSMTVFENDQTIRLWNFGPAHTDGDAVVYFEEAQVVHMGDLYHGLSDPSVGEDMLGLLATLEQVERRVPETALIVTGHGGVTSLDELRRYTIMLRETIDRVEAAVRRGATLQQVQGRGVPERWRRTIPDADVANAWLQEIYRTLTEVER